MKRLALLASLCSAACSMPNASESQTITSSQRPNISTVFTIVFENEDASSVLVPANPTFYGLAQKYAAPAHYGSSTHPSLPNYIVMTSGSTNGVVNDNDPNENFRVPGTENVAAQLDASNLMWRAYMESMGAPCTMASDGALYSAHHNPFLYYAYVAGDSARCQQHVVDFSSFEADLGSNLYRYMWITPNACDDMHNCEASVGDAWLAKWIPIIQASEAYRAGGAIFILFDEGSGRGPGAYADLPVLVISERLAEKRTTTQFDHASYLATVEDALQLGRLSTTTTATSLNELFQSAP